MQLAQSERLLALAQPKPLPALHACTGDRGVQRAEVLFLISEKPRRRAEERRKIAPADATRRGQQKAGGTTPPEAVPFSAESRRTPIPSRHQDQATRAAHRPTPLVYRGRGPRIPPRRERLGGPHPRPKRPEGARLMARLKARAAHAATQHSGQSPTGRPVGGVGAVG